MSELELYENEPNYEAAEAAGLAIIEGFVEKARAAGWLRTKRSTNSYANEVIDRLNGDEGNDDELIEPFVSEVYDWQQTYRSAGANDTASREALVSSVVQRLHGM